MQTRAVESSPVERLGWRPQRARSTVLAASIRDAILEPLWNGVHVLVHYESGGLLQAIDQDGNDATTDEPGVAAELARSILASDAVLDGFLTDQATRSGEGMSMTLRPHVSRLQPFLPPKGEVELGPPESELALPTGSAVAFVAVDLLRVDGEDLLDLPLLERKRLLEGVIAPSHLVRVSPFARPPIGQWLASWKGAGFAGIVAKAANSRYRPSSITEEWAVYTRLR